MAALADKVLGNLHFSLEQVQDLTPTPMTLSSVMFYMGENPYDHKPLYVARSQDDKRRQKSYFFGGELPADRSRTQPQSRHNASRPQRKDSKRGGSSRPKPRR